MVVHLTRSPYPCALYAVHCEQVAAYQAVAFAGSCNESITASGRLSHHRRGDALKGVFYPCYTYRKGQSMLCLLYELRLPVEGLDLVFETLALHERLGQLHRYHLHVGMCD